MSDFTPQECATLLEWAAVLRMGKYKQTMLSYETDDGSFCAAGAYIKHRYNPQFWCYNKWADTLPMIASIAHINDSGATFHDIANLIEAAARTGDRSWLNHRDFEENLIRVKQRL